MRLARPFAAYRLAVLGTDVIKLDDYGCLCSIVNAFELSPPPDGGRA